MKKRLLFICMAVGSAIALKAQDIHLGVNTGLNFSHFSYNLKDKAQQSDAEKNAQYTTGFVLGVPVEFDYNPLFSLVLEPGFIQKGYQSYDTFGQSYYKGVLTSNYLELPILAKLKFGEEDVSGYFLIGPSLSYALSVSRYQETNQNGKVESRTTSINFNSDHYNNIDAAFNIGVGVAIKAGTGNVLISTKYQYGLLNLNTYPKAKDDYKVYNSGFMLTAGYSWNNINR